MFNTGFGSHGNTGDFESLARQYWGAWGEAMRQGAMAAAPAPPPPTGGWQQAVDWWSQLLPRTPSPANDAVARFNQQARDWYGQMQQVAGQFAGRDSTPGDVSQAWRQALGASGANPFPEMFKSMSGKGLHGLDDWIEQAKPFLDNVQQQAERWLHLPAFGQHREHQERLQALVQANTDYQKATVEFNALMGQCAQRAFAVFEDKLAQHEAPGEQVTSARALFDLWVDAAEQAYAETALSEEFRHRYGALTNAQMRLRGAVQVEIEQMGAQFGMPTRTEVDSAHRKIAELERALRRASKAALGAGARQAPARGQADVEAARPAPARPRATPVADEDAADTAASPRKAATRKRAASKQSSRETAATRTTARKTATGKKAARKTATKTTAAKQTAAKKSTRKKAAATGDTTARRAAGKRSTDKASARKAPAKKTDVASKPAAGKASSSPKATVAAAAKTRVRKSKSGKAAAKQTTRKSAARKSMPAASAAAAGTNGGKVVSMKDWVARYTAAQGASEAANDAAGGNRKRKDGRK